MGTLATVYRWNADLKWDNRMRRFLRRPPQQQPFVVTRVALLVRTGLVVGFGLVSLARGLVEWLL